MARKPYRADNTNDYVAQRYSIMVDISGFGDEEIAERLKMIVDSIESKRQIVTSVSKIHFVE